MNLTPGERFLLWRRRRGITRAKAAKHYGSTARRVREWEFDRGNLPPPRVELLPAQLSPAEMCFFWRRRARLEAFEVGQIIGVTGKTILQRERGMGDVHALYNYWRARGAA